MSRVHSHVLRKFSRPCVPAPSILPAPLSQCAQLQSPEAGKRRQQGDPDSLSYASSHTHQVSQYHLTYPFAPPSSTPHPAARWRVVAARTDPFDLSMSKAFQAWFVRISDSHVRENSPNIFCRSANFLYGRTLFATMRLQCLHLIKLTKASSREHLGTPRFVGSDHLPPNLAPTL